MRKKLRYDLATNFDDRIIDFIKENDPDHRIKTLYGKIKEDGLPGGRNSSVIQECSYEKLEDFVRKCNSIGVYFDYLINPLCMGQMEFDPRTAKSLRNTIHTIYDCGVRKFTVNSPVLVKYIKEEFPDVFITLGLYAYPTSIRSLKMWQEWGVDEITLEQSFNRNFELLEKVFRTFKDTNLRLRLIANNLCLKDCMFKMAHGSFVSHTDPSGYVMDYQLLKCTYLKITRPTSLITSEWIRPDDIHYYEELCDRTGFENLTIKLVDRLHSTDYLENVARSYINESYDGNLLSILNWNEKRKLSFGKQKEFPVMKNMPYYSEPWKTLPLLGRVMQFPTINIDNRALDGFMDHFVNNFRCTETLCKEAVLDSCDNSSYACGYCKSYADKAVSFDKAEVAEWKAAADELFRTIEMGTFSSISPMMGAPMGRPMASPVVGSVGGPMAGAHMPGGPMMSGPMAGSPMMGGPMAGGPMMGGPMVGGPMMGGPVPGGPMMGGPVPGGPMMGGPMTGGPMMGDPMTDGPVPGGPMAGQLVGADKVRD